MGTRYIRVISGTSGGSIIAGMLALHTEKELMEKVGRRQTRRMDPICT